MIATKRGLVVLVVLALVLGVFVLLVGPRTRSLSDRSLVPHFDADHITQLTYHCPDDPHDVTATRDGKAWRLADAAATSTTATATADGATIDATLAALRGARWHRRGAVALASQTRCTLRVGDQTIAIGADLAGADQTWVVRGSHAYLVDSWVAHALAPGRLALHVRHPLVDVKLDPHFHGIWLDPAFLDDVRTALDTLELVALDGTPAPVDIPHAPTGTEALGATRIGTCPANRILISTTSGTGCVEAPAWQRIVDAAAKLSGPPEQIADRRPVPIIPTKLVLPDRKELTLTGSPKIDGADADLDRVRELLTAISTPGELVPVPTSAATDAFYARAADGTDVQLRLFGKGVLVRRGEPIAIKTPADKIIAQTAAAYRDPTRWREDATTITSIVVDRVTYTRGAVLGEWNRHPAGPLDNAIVDALAQTLAIVRAPSNAGNGKTTSGRRIKVTFTPPAGAPSAHTLVVSTVIRDGCRGNVDGAEVILSPELCTAAAALQP